MIKAPVTKPPTAELLITIGAKRCQQHHKHSDVSSEKSDEEQSRNVDTVVNGNESAN